MIRFICIAVFLILYLILSIPVFLVEWIIGKFNRRAKDISSLRIVQWGFKVILKMTGVTTTVIGEENVPDEPVLFIGNHRSYLDILKTILQAIDYVKNGISICIFPEGTRNNGEELSMLPFRDGALKIAEKTGCAIIPISMNNTADIFEAHFPRVKKVHVVIEYGKPIYPKELDKETRKHLGIYCHDLIQDTIKKNASLI